VQRSSAHYEVHIVFWAFLILFDDIKSAEVCAIVVQILNDLNVSIILDPHELPIEALQTKLISVFYNSPGLAFVLQKLVERNLALVPGQIEVWA
jgi:hypothetical protein